MLHAKLMIIDEEIAEVGAANSDMRSFRLNYEVCQVVYSANMGKGTEFQGFLPTYAFLQFSYLCLDIVCFTFYRP